ncbi:hypothetical protein G7Z17_g6800 [Cylindrodendrum hubeiense]|uniref:Uncharacterized protein n=1 Tax=Cylindrodendrum hubeiense TaxID=595255 RepID=A0A9P5LET6_9HYPO|nr:hypothetical protein G7Z17_g6800 [Cylindrodendrum hubeiense]
MHPVLTDDEIAATFTPLEHEFRKWYDDGGYIDMITQRPSSTPGHEPEFQFQMLWPGIEGVHQKWIDFVQKWVQRRWTIHPLSVKEYVDLVRSTPCYDPYQLSKFPLILTSHDLVCVNIGESRFGGVSAGYALCVEPCRFRMGVGACIRSNSKRHSPESCILSSDVSPNEADHAHLLDDRVISIDLKNDLKAPLNVFEFLGEAASCSTPSASIDDLLDQEAFCLFQIGSLMYCVGDAWKTSLDVEAFGIAGYQVSDYGRFHWEETDYKVVVQVGPDGCPSGPVYVVHDSQPVSGYSSPGRRERELPGPLAKDSSPQFFLAKIADRIEDFKEEASFEFQILRKERHNILRVKKARNPERFIPIDDVSESDSEFGDEDWSSA